MACPSDSSKRVPSEEADAAARRPAEPLVVFATGDVRGELEPCGCQGPKGGAPRRVEVLRSRRALIVDAGDHFFRATWIPPGRRAVARAHADGLSRALSEVGAHVMTIGERDLALGLDRLIALARSSSVALVSANLRGLDGRAVFPASVDRLGARVIGVTTATTATTAYAAAGLRWTPPAPALDAALAEPRSAPSQTVVLVHGTSAGAAALLGSLPRGRVDLAVVAHGGEATPSEIVLDNGVRVVSTGRRGQYVVRAELGGVRRVEAIALTSSVGEDRAMRSAVASIQREIRRSTRAAWKAKPKDLKYVGEKACRPCHRSIAGRWKKSAHGRAWRALERTRQIQNVECITCHATGFDRPGGPARAAIIRPFIHVGCESCHGAGRAHAEAKAPKAVPMGAVSRAICSDCHRVDAHQTPRALDAAWAQPHD